MDKRTIVYLVQLVLLYGHGAHQTQERLPKYVFIVKSCPHPNNINEWEKASYRLNCLHPPTSTDMGNAYHCLPTSFSNETVEFCGEGIFVPPGHCPIYNYTDKADDKPGLYNCYAFISGCPTERFSSRDVRKFPSCLNINREHGCYEEESSCPKTSVTHVPKETTNNVNTVTISTSQSIPTDSSPDIPTPDIHDETMYVLTILITIGAALIGQMISLRYMCIYRCRYLQMKNSTTGTDDETPIEMEDGNSATLVNVSVQHRSQDKASDGDSTTLMNGINQHRSQENGHGNHEGGESIPLLENMANGSIMGQYNNLLRSLAKNMTGKVLKRIKCFVKDREEVNCKDLEEIKEPKDLLEFLDKKYFVFNNVIYLQGFFLACKAPELYDQCVEYAKNRGEEIHFFEKGGLKKGHTEVKYIINCPGVSEYQRSELEKLRLMLATLIHANYDDILVSGVKTGCVIVTMMIRNCLIPTLKALYTSEKLTLTCHWMLKLSLKHKIIKVMIQDEIIYPPVSDVVLTKTIPSESNDFTKFLERIGGRITDDTWHSMKFHLRKFVDHKRVEKMNPTKMLNELSDMLKLQYNMSFLEWIFDKCGKPKLVKDCQQYSAENQCQLECFKTNFPQSVESQPIEIQFMVFELESYRNELQDLRYWLAKTIDVHPGQILMTALQNGPIVVTFLMRENHGNAILEYLKTDDGQIAASHKRIKKIVQNGNVFEIGKALNGSTFVHIRLRLRRNRSGIRESERNLASIFTRRTGIPMEGTEVYTRTVPVDRKRNAPAKKWIQQNREDLLDEIDSEFIKSTIYQLEDVPEEVKTSWSDPNKSRTEKAKKFLDFALQKDECVKAFKKTMEEYGMQLPE